jgi:hypothetical protein
VDDEKQITIAPTAREKGSNVTTNIRMTNPTSAKRADEIDGILECIGEAWQKAPYMRPGLLIHNATENVASIEDWPLVKAIESGVRQ